YISPLILKICFFLSTMSLLISSSRTSIIAVIVALLFLFYKLSKHKVGKTFKFVFSVSAILILSFPLWSSYTSGITEKFQGNDDGDLLSRREEHWTARVAEFKSSPIVGVGFWGGVDR
ncbi:O-antigen ligase family protein, partial [Kaistella sp. SH19-2b]|uniref:O-antigen ligase family protein n=1 Tax=Kaistella sp. SH19-2b TaxID=2986944 RepID=UPI0027328F06